MKQDGTSGKLCKHASEGSLSACHEHRHHRACVEPSIHRQLQRVSTAIAVRRTVCAGAVVNRLPLEGEPKYFNRLPRAIQEFRVKSLNTALAHDWRAIHEAGHPFHVA
eukprot:scaffold80959_cov18-Tisochrysis_lutea.AAC.3